MKKYIAILFVVISMITLFTSAVAENNVSNQEEEALLERLRVVPEFKFQNYNDGIGTGEAPVYTAPSTDAFRCANGRARCDFSEFISESNYLDGWLFVRYKIDEDHIRVGYVKGKYVPSGFKSSMGKLHPERIPVTAASDIMITDDPVLAGTPFGTIKAGETFYIMMKYTYTGSWWYVECAIEGKQARGFIDRKTSSFYLGESVKAQEDTQAYNLSNIGYPEEDPNGNKQIGHVEVYQGKRKSVRNKPDLKATQITVAYPGRYYPCYEVIEKKAGPDWYYIWIEEDSKWGWFYAYNGQLVRDAE